MTQRSDLLDSPDFAPALGRALLEAGDVAVLLVDHELLVRGANDVARDALGEGLRTGDPLSAAVDEPDVERLRERVTGETGDGPLLLRSASASGDPAGALVVSVLPVQGPDGPVLALVGRVASADVEREARILRARRWEIVGQLTSGVAHDLNNRLSTVTTFSDLMLGDVEPGSQEAEDLAEIKQAGLDSASITRKLDLFAGGHAGGQSDCSLPDVVRGFEKLIRRFIGEAVTLQTDLDDACPRVGAPPIRLEEILIALVANARDAMPGGGTLTLRAAPGGDGDPSGSAVLEVRDTGAEDVIAPLERALEPFFSSKPHGLGSGMGLGTAEGIATDLGGSVSLHRKDGETVARVVLPGLAEGDEASDDLERSDGARPSGPLRVGLVEPDDMGRRVMARALERRGDQVVAVSGPAELEPGLFPLDALVLDVPDEPNAGARLVAEVRARGGEIPVVLLRRRASPRATLPGTPGVVELAKPTDLDHIRSALRAACGPIETRADTL